MKLFKIPFKKNSSQIPSKSFPVGFKLLSVAILSLYSGLVIARNTQWHDALTLMHHDIKHLNESAQAQNLLATHLIIEALNDTNDLARKRLLEEAESHYDKAVTIYPEFFNAYYDLGRVRMMLNKLNEAETPFLKVIELDSTFIDPFFNVALIRTQTGNYKGAIPYYLKYLKKYPENLDALNNLSFCYVRMNNLPEALSVMKKATAIYPQRPEPLINQIRIFLDWGIPDSVNYYLQRVEAIAPNHPDVIQLKNSLQKAEYDQANH